MVEAFEYLHSRGIVYRDLKVTNYSLSEYFLERFSIAYLKVNTQVTTRANQSKGKLPKEPMRTQSKATDDLEARENDGGPFLDQSQSHEKSIRRNSRLLSTFGSVISKPKKTLQHCHCCGTNEQTCISIRFISLKICFWTKMDT